jgi:hypothetical protein
MFEISYVFLVFNDGVNENVTGTKQEMTVIYQYWVEEHF